MPTKRTYASHGDACATSHAMDLLGDRWTYPVVRELLLAPKRFGELEAALHGITPAVLTARLRDLEACGIIRRTTLPAPASVTVYESTPWAQELRPALEALARWALKSPVRDVDGCGLTPDAIVHSMRTMAPPIAMAPPLEIELHLRDTRIIRAAGPYVYLLRWGEHLTIERGRSSTAEAAVAGDSSLWTRVLYERADLDTMDVHGDRAAVERLVAAFDRVIPDAIQAPPAR